MEELDTWELLQWQVYFNCEPFGPWAENLNAGKTQAVLANIFAGKKSKTVTGEYMALGVYKRPERKQSQSAMRQVLGAIAQAFNAKKRKKEDGDVS